MTYYRSLTMTGKLILWAVVALAVIALLWAAYGALTGRSKAEARLGKNQAEAAAQSGSDAVNTVGKAGEREADSDALTRTNNEEIMDADGADEAVNPAARDAGLNSLCRRSAYRNNPKCVQYAHPR